MKKKITRIWSIGLVLVLADLLLFQHSAQYVVAAPDDGVGVPVDVVLLRPLRG